LVAVNTEIIVNIENTLNQIYNRYFANPNKDWKIVNLSTLVHVVTGKRDANYASNSGPYNFFTCSERILKCDDYSFEGKAILIAGNGNFNIKLYEGKFDAYQRTYVLIPSKEDFYSLIYLAVKDRIQSLSQNSRGSIVKFITKGDIEDIPIVIPDAEHLYLLKTMNRLTKLLELKKTENSEIINRRNLYLPFLFSKILS
jgi:type I restriction enzyme S subunit